MFTITSSWQVREYLVSMIFAVSSTTMDPSHLVITSAFAKTLMTGIGTSMMIRGGSLFLKVRYPKKQLIFCSTLERTLSRKSSPKYSRLLTKISQGNLYGQNMAMDLFWVNQTRKLMEKMGRKWNSTMSWFAMKHMKWAATISIQTLILTRSSTTRQKSRRLRSRCRVKTRKSL